MKVSNESAQEEKTLVAVADDEEEHSLDDFVEVEDDCIEDPYVLIDEDSEEENEEVDEDFVLTHMADDAVDEKNGEEEADLIAIAKTKKLVFFLSLLVATYVIAINTVAGICMLAKSIRTLDFKVKQERRTTVFLGAEPAAIETVIVNNRLNIPSLTSTSAAKVLQPARMMIPRPSRHFEPALVVLADDEEEEKANEHYSMPSPAIAKAPAATRSGVVPPDIDASTYRALPKRDEELFPSLDTAWPQPTPSPRRAYPTLSSMSVVQSVKATTEVMVVGDMVQSPPKSHPLNFPAVGGNIPYSPTLHIPSVAVDRVRNFWNHWVWEEPAAPQMNNNNNTTAAPLIPVPGSPSKVSQTSSTTATQKIELDTFIQTSGDHAIVLFFESYSDDSFLSLRDLLSAWQDLSDKVRYSMKVDCTVERLLCASYGDRLPFALMVSDGRLRHPLELDYDPLHMFTNYIKALESVESRVSTPNSRSVVTPLSQYSFREFLSQNKHVVVAFDLLDNDSSNVEHQQVWNAFSQALEGEGLNVVMATVDCHSNPIICRDEGIAEYPTIRWFSSGSSTVRDFGKRLVKKKFIKYARRVLAGIE